MQTNIKSFLIIFLALSFASCGSTNQTQKSMKGNVNAEEKAVEKIDLSGTAKGEAANNKVGNGSDNLFSGDVVDSNGKKVRAVPSSTNHSQEEIMKKKLAEINGAVTPAPPKVSAPSSKTKPSAPVVPQKSVKTPEVKVPTPSIPTVPEVPVIAGATTHEDWNDLVSKHISSSGVVNYRGFIGDKAKLKAYLAKLSEAIPESNWTRNEKMAYWINAYNAFTIKKIIDNYPLKSITDLAGGKIWDEKWIKLGNKTYSLNNIENDILRPRFKDGRIHFAVNCAAKSCPPIHNRAFTAATLNGTLAKLTKKFVNDSNYNTISNSSVSVSKIFEWYADDFGNLIEFLNKYSDVEIADNATIGYEEYNWDLNQ